MMLTLRFREPPHSNLPLPLGVPVCYLFYAIYVFQGSYSDYLIQKYSVGNKQFATSYPGHNSHFIIILFPRISIIYRFLYSKTFKIFALLQTHRYSNSILIGLKPKLDCPWVKSVKENSSSKTYTKIPTVMYQKEIQPTYQRVMLLLGKKCNGWAELIYRFHLKG